MNYDKGPRKIFISSTCLDLIDVRAELKRELESLGYIAYTSETPDFPVNDKITPIDNCLDVVGSCDIYLLVIHSRYGGEYDGVRELPNAPEDPPGGRISVTLAELLVARSKNLETRIWVRDSIWNSRPVFRKADSESSKDIDLPTKMEPAVYDFLDFLQNSPDTGRLWINQFHDVTDLKPSVTTWLKERAYSNEKQFKEEVSNLFRLQGFELNADELMVPGVQRVLTRNPNDSFETQYALWTYYQPANAVASWRDLQETVFAIQDDLRLERYEKAFLVVSGGYREEVVNNLIDRKLQRRVRLQSYIELLGGLINFNSYIKKIVHDYENFVEYADPANGRDPVIAIMRRCNLFRFFVPLRARMVMNSRRKFDGEMETYIDGWLKDDGRNHVTILGDFGTGKSSFALWLTYTLAQEILEKGWHTNRIPVFISLRDHAGKIDVREIVTNTLINKYDIRNADYKSFERLLEAGRLLIVLDGFDETATLTDRANTLRILRGLNSLVRRNSKVILTCRSHYFRTDEETQSELSRSWAREETELFAEQKGKDNYEVIQLREFRRDQIELFLERHYDGDKEKTKSTLSKMQATYNLTDLSRRPVMLEMILKVWPRLLERSKDIEVTPALLYTEYVDAWINDVAKGNEELMDPITKRLFCQDLTKWMYRENRELLPYTEIERVVKDYFKNRPPAVYAALDTEVRTCTFLNRDSVGNYQFAHRSFMEFFVAKSCAEELESEQYDLLKLRPLSPEITNFLRGFINSDLLWSAIRWTKKKDINEVGYVGGNAATLLALMGQSFKDADLEDTVLLEADLTNTDVTGANLRHAILQGSKLFNTSLDGSDLRDADLSNISISELGAISCLAWSPDGNFLAVGEGANVRIIDCANKKFTSLLRGHRRTVVDMAFIPNSNLLCSVADDLIVWDCDKGLLMGGFVIGKLNEVKFDVISLNFHPPFITITARDDSFTLKLSTFRKQSFYSNVPRFSVGVKDSSRIVVRDWSKAGAEIFSSEPHEGEITTACFSPTDSAIAVGTTERKAYVWDCFTGNLISLFEGKPFSCKNMRIEGAKGLNVGDYSVQHDSCKGTLGEWLIERGASWPELSTTLDKTKALLQQLDEDSEDFSVFEAEKKAREVLSSLIATESKYLPYKDIDTLYHRETLDFPKISSEDVESALSSIEELLIQELSSDLVGFRPNSSRKETLHYLVKELSKTTDTKRHQNVIRDIECLRLSDPNGDSFEKMVDELKRHIEDLLYWHFKFDGAVQLLTGLRNSRRRIRMRVVEFARDIVTSIREADVLELSSVLK